MQQHKKKKNGKNWFPAKHSAIEEEYEKKCQGLPAKVNLKVQLFERKSEYRKLGITGCFVAHIIN